MTLLYHLHHYILKKRNYTAISLPPLFCSTLFILLGIIWQRLFDNFYAPFFCWVIFMLLATRIEKFSYKAIICATSFIIGCALYKHQNMQQAYWCSQLQKNSFDCLATIDHIAQKDHPFLKYTYLCTINTIKNLSYACYANKKILIISPKKLTYEVGDQIYLQKLSAKQPSSLSLQDYLMKENIVSVVVLGTHAHELFHRPRYHIYRWLNTHRLRIIDTIKYKISRKAFALISLLFFGNKCITKIDANHLKTLCQRWGISHYLARSGLHLIIVVALWNFFLSLLPIGLYIKEAILILLMIIYWLLSWSSLSFMRSFFIILTYKVGAIMHQPIHTLNSIVLITFVLIILNPVQIYFLDFQLSFGVTFILAWLNQLKHQKTYYAQTIA